MRATRPATAAIVASALGLLATLGAACTPALPNGGLRCAPDPARPCPRGYHCAADGACWRDGTGPTGDLDLGVPDGGEVADLAEGPLDLTPPPKELGASCAAGTECASGHCVDEVCCDTACDDGPCRSCIAEGKVGMCSTVTGGPIGGKTCAGDTTGACAGSCDGTKAACSYPASGTGCGSACNGTCNGAGVCSVQGTGSCPNGFVCGGATCKTSCAGPADCQPFFTCNSGNNQCQRIPEADCLDGLDNNGDGLKDCEDPTCSAIVQCVPEPSVGVKHGYALGAGFSCSPTALFDNAQTLYQGLMNTGCAGCSCGVTLDCDYAMRFYPIRSYCNDLGGTYKVDATFTLRWGGSLCDATGLMESTANGSSSVRALGVSGGTVACQQTAAAVKQVPSWGGTGTYCAARKTSATCGVPTQVCAPRPPGPGNIKQCVRVPGAGQTCPTGYGDPRGTWHNAALNDTRDCQCQNCSVSSSKTCTDPSLLALPTIETWQNTTCNGASVGNGIVGITLSSGGGESECENSGMPSTWPSELRSVRFKPSAQSVGSCTIDPVLASGSVTTTGDVTVCCQ